MYTYIHIRYTGFRFAPSYVPLAVPWFRVYRRRQTGSKHALLMHFSKKKKKKKTENPKYKRLEGGRLSS